MRLPLIPDLQVCLKLSPLHTILAHPGWLTHDSFTHCHSDQPSPRGFLRRSSPENVASLPPLESHQEAAVTDFYAQQQPVKAQHHYDVAVRGWNEGVAMPEHSDSQT